MTKPVGPDELQQPLAMDGTEVLLAEIEPLLNMGALTDLLEWTERLEQEQPQHVDLARRVRELIARGDFEGVRALWQLV